LERDMKKTELDHLDFESFNLKHASSVRRKCQPAISSAITVAGPRSRLSFYGDSNRSPSIFQAGAKARKKSTLFSGSPFTV
jgi:hypothetical protein